MDELTDRSAENDPLGDRCKSLESVTDVRLDPALPLVIRLDGRSFSRFTSSLEKPFFWPMHEAMCEVALRLAHECSARFAYTQSDEITLVLDGASGDTQPWFGGRLLKVASVLASLATLSFHHACAARDVHGTGIALFDCRVFSAPSRKEAWECVLWRELDAAKNSVSMLARAHFSAKSLHGKSSQTMRAMLREAGHPWESLHPRLRYGSGFHRVTVRRAFSAEEIASLPPKHAARAQPDLIVERQDYLALTSPVHLCENPEAVVFEGASPVIPEASNRAHPRANAV